MDVIQIVIGRFHHFHLARQLERHGLLKSIWSGYPKFKLRDEHGIPSDKIKTFPWLQTLYMGLGKFGIPSTCAIQREINWLAHETLDRRVASQIVSPGVIIGLSGSGLHSGLKMKSLGGKYICDRGSSHIQYQDRLLREESQLWGQKYLGIDPRKIEKEIREYESADFITVPSDFARNSFIELGLSPRKIVKIPYGVNLQRFAKNGSPDKNKFRILWVGNVSLQKGFLYLLEAFRQLNVVGKELMVVGRVMPEIANILKKRIIENVRFLGEITNKRLPLLYSTSNVFVLPSIQEGMGMVLGEALACGCPVIASENTGARDLFTDGSEGFVVPIREPAVIRDRLLQLAEDTELHQKMSESAMRLMKGQNGWNRYGDAFAELIRNRINEHN